MSTHASDRAPTPQQPQLRLLGGFQLELGGQPLWLPHSVRRVIAFLGIRGRSDRTEVAGTLWPELPEPKARASLRTALWRMHRLTTAPVVTGSEALALAPAVRVDLQAFGAAVQQLVAGDEVPDRVPAAVLPATGELLPGWYDDWVLFERERIRQQRLHALETLAGRLTAAGRYGEAIDAALTAVRLEPLRESATRALILAHLGEGNLVEAVRCFDSFRDQLAVELGVHPTAQLAQLVQSCLSRQT